MEDYKKITRYIESLYKSKEYLLQKSYVKDMEVKKYIPTVDDCTANFLRLLIKLTKPMNILEIGTSVGYSTTSMALEVKEYGGKITTIEFDENVASQAEQNFKNAGVDNTITLLKGDAMDIVAKTRRRIQYDFSGCRQKIVCKVVTRLY
jgi:predicted O-methyltransferase YrrM